MMAVFKFAYPVFLLSNKVGAWAWTYVQVQIVKIKTIIKLWKLKSADFKNKWIALEMKQELKGTIYHLLSNEGHLGLTRNNKITKII